MNMIGHDEGNAKAVTPFMVVDAAGENDVAGPAGQDTSELGVERDEVRSEVALDMWEIATVELHGALCHFGFRC